MQWTAHVDHEEQFQFLEGELQVLLMLALLHAVDAQSEVMDALLSGDEQRVVRVRLGRVVQQTLTTGDVQSAGTNRT